MNQTFSFVRLTYQGVGVSTLLAKILRRFPKLIDKARPNSEQELNELIQRNQHLRDTQFAYVHAVALMAAWGALEAFIEDVCLGALLDEPALFSSEPLGKTKIQVASLAGSQTELMQDILDAAYTAQRSALKSGKGEFESRLKLVGLDGPVPRELSDELFVVQKLRNLWAHRAGVADRKFVDETPDYFPYRVGDTVDISSSAMNVYLMAILVYGTVVLNRYCAKKGLSEQVWPARPGRPNSFEQTYLELYGKPLEATSDSPPNTSPTASDAPPPSPDPQTGEASPAETSSSDSAQDPRT